jgi:hypothetical protein
VVPRSWDGVGALWRGALEGAEVGQELEVVGLGGPLLAADVGLVEVHGDIAGPEARRGLQERELAQRFERAEVDEIELWGRGYAGGEVGDHLPALDGSQPRSVVEDAQGDGAWRWRAEAVERGEGGECVARAVDQEVLGEIEVRIRGWRVHAVECARGRWWRARVVSGW